MNMRFIMMLSLAFLLALGAAFFANKLMRSGSDKAVKTTPVVVSVAELADDIKLEDINLKEVDWPEGLLPEGAFTSKVQAIGRFTTSKLFPGEPITNKRTSETMNTLSARITEEYRALSVRVDDVVGVAGFILPGNKVDILTTKRVGDMANTKTLLQNIKVLAVDQEASQEKDKPAIVRAVTIELKPEQTEIIVKAMQEGTIQLTLRNPKDNLLTESVGNVKKTSDAQPVPVKKYIRRVVRW
jgi:pilus assembly protein CpaB